MTVSPIPNYKSDFDTLPGNRYFTCNNYELELDYTLGETVQDDGMHFRQSWAFGVQEEVERLRREVDDMAEEIAKIKRRLIPRPPVHESRDSLFTSSEYIYA
ncbi:unnamed protein product [Eruca vesicaria subsp. sativa]|uniref:Uncharacterized protein n=1 Tax=Eruca vesicaria subsp. sativa TaxID=29727 RepID=A0ABC8J6Z3_ERUVS|nr:unnamed protein product [Eruca vesicaria subsp. sativa]